ncbi:MAG: RNA methyltransferase [Bacteroidetes bacterium]|nr:RNA methyltransferase [Bacteroidota bacterium]
MLNLNLDMKLSINQLKYLKSLRERKYRQKYHNFIVEGVKLANETLISNALDVEMVVATSEWLSQNANLLKAVDNIVPVTESELKKISLLSTPNQVFLVAKQPNQLFEKNKISPKLSLYLDDIRDPGNLGTILRIADWFGIPWVFCSPGSVEVFNPKVVQSSMGAFLRVKYMEIEFEDLLARLPETPVYGTVLDGSSIFSEQLLCPAIIAIGNESNGLSSEIQLKLTHRISIPRGQGGGAESLNAGVAAGIVCSMFTNKVMS